MTEKMFISVPYRKQIKKMKQKYPYPRNASRNMDYNRFY